MSLHAENNSDVMESVTDAAKDVVVGQLDPAFGNVTVELSVLTLLQLRHSPAAPVDVVNLKQTYLVTPAIGAALSTQDIHGILAHAPVLFAPLTSLFLNIVIAALPPSLAVGRHVLPHVLAMFPTALLRRSVTVVFLSHKVSISPNYATSSVR